MQNVIIIGTSNALMREGWVNQTREIARNAGWDYVNRSVGGSSSLLGAWMIATSDELRQADRILVDFCINDQLFIQGGQARLAHLLGHYGAMAQELDRRGVLDRLLVLMLPQQHVDDAMFDALIAFFRLVGLRHIDFRPVVEDWAQRAGQPVGMAYSDPFHFNPEMQRRIGEQVLAALTAAPAAPPGNPEFRRWLGQCAPLGLVNLTITADHAQPCEVGTSVIRRHALRFAQGARFELSGAALLAGAFIWATREAGVLTVRGAGKGFRVHLRRDYAGLFIFDSIFTPLGLPDPTVVEVRNDKTVPFQRMRGQQSSVYDDTGSTVEVVALIGAARAPADLGDEIATWLAGRTAPFWRRALGWLRRAGRTKSRAFG